jgi:hypothetical protein
MTATTKQILSELQRIDSGEPLTLSLSPRIYSPLVINKVMESIAGTNAMAALGGDRFLLDPTHGDVLHALLILTVRSLS